MSDTVTVNVWDRPYEITVYQKSKSVWIATGSYMDESLQTKDSSRGAAIKRWCEAAKYKGG